MKTYTITESKAQLSALVQEVITTGKPVVIGRTGKPMVQLVPYHAPESGKRIGIFQGQITIADDFDKWGEAEAQAFGMRDR